MRFQQFDHSLRASFATAYVPPASDHVTVRIAGVERAGGPQHAVSLAPAVTVPAAPPVLAPQSPASPDDTTNDAGSSIQQQACSCGMQNGNRLLTTVEAARYLRVSAEWLEKLRVYGLKNGSPPPFVRLGRFVKYRLSDLDAYVERNLARNTSEYDQSAH